MISKEFLALLFILARDAAALRQCKTIPAYMQLLHQDDFFNPPVPTPGTKTVNETKRLRRVTTANCAEKLESEEEFGVQREVWGFRNATRKPRFPWEKKKTVRYSFELGATSELFIYDENGDSPTAHHASWVKREEEESLVSMFVAPLNYSAVDLCWEYTFHHARIVREFVDLRFREVSQTCRNQKWTVIRPKVTLQLQPTDLFSSQRWCTEVHPLAPNTTYEFSMKYHGRGIWSQSSFGRTSEVRPFLPPTQLELFETADPATVILKWKPFQQSCANNVFADAYFVYFGFWDGYDYWWKRVRVVDDRSRAQISGLRANTRYYFALQALNSLGTGTYSPVHSYTTRSS